MSIQSKGLKKWLSSLLITRAHVGDRSPFLGTECQMRSTISSDLSASVHIAISFLSLWITVLLVLGVLRAGAGVSIFGRVSETNDVSDLSAQPPQTCGACKAPIVLLRGWRTLISFPALFFPFLLSCITLPVMTVNKQHDACIFG
ncbi:hypothetical protein BJV74DRAFT_493849 [Russula compacta]|nr:hypothetical protein BJV74DRAFT_493849 [Russula compacta]